jgi:four helix bundle protein
VGLATRFEDLQAWQAARRLTQQVYEVVQSPKLRRDFGLADQMRRAAVSAMNNVAEGFDSASRVEFARFLRYAARSASEVQSSLYVCLDQDFVSQAEFHTVYDQAERVRRMCRALHQRLARKKVDARADEQVRDPDVTWNAAWAPQWIDAPTRLRGHARTR